MRRTLLTACAITLLFSGSALAFEGCNGGVKWLQYTAPGHEFSIQYPNTARPEVLDEKQVPGLLLHTAFAFEQPIIMNGVSLRLSLQVSVWHNTSHLSAQEWAKQHSDPHLVSAAGALKVATFDGYMIRSTNMVAQIIYIYIASADRIYQLHYTDIADGQDIPIPSELKSCWRELLDRMIQSFSPEIQRQ
jgi:hypothetical protein